MTTNNVARSERRLGKSAVAIGAGFILIVALSLAVDQLLHVLNVYPPWGEPMFEPGLNLLALSYRIIISIVGCYATARLAPRNPMRHAIVLGAIGLVLSTLGAITAAQLKLGPLWYPVALVVVALPCAWIGGLLYELKLKQAIVQA